MTPPELARDAPVADIFQPVFVDSGKARRDKVCLLVAHCLQSRLGKWFHFHEPLLRDQRFHNGTAAVAVTHGMTVFFNFFYKAQGLQVLHHFFTAVIPIEAGIGARRRGHFAIFIDHRNDLKIMALTDLKVIGIVGRRHFDRPAAESGINIVVGNDGDLPIEQRQNNFAPHQTPVSLIFGVDGDPAVAEHRLRPRRRHNDITAAVSQRIADMGKGGIPLLMFHLNIGKGGMATGTPVDHVVALVDQPGPVQVDKNAAHRPGAALIHREALPGPVTGGSERMKLPGDMPVVYLFPFPDLLQKALSAQLMAGEPFTGKILLHPDLGGDAGVVCSRQPKGIITLHPPPADQRILYGDIESMAHMQRTSNIGRGNHDSKGLRILFPRSPKVVPLKPEAISLFFNSGRIIGRRNQIGGHTFTSSCLLLKFILFFSPVKVNQRAPFSAPGGGQPLIICLFRSIFYPLSSK